MPTSPAVIGGACGYMYTIVCLWCACIAVARSQEPKVARAYDLVAIQTVSGSVMLYESLTGSIAIEDAVWIHGVYSGVFIAFHAIYFALASASKTAIPKYVYLSFGMLIALAIALSQRR